MILIAGSYVLLNDLKLNQSELMEAILKFKSLFQRNPTIEIGETTMKIFLNDMNIDSDDYIKDDKFLIFGCDGLVSASIETGVVLK